MRDLFEKAMCKLLPEGWKGVAGREARGMTGVTSLRGRARLVNIAKGNAHVNGSQSPGKLV